MFQNGFYVSIKQTDKREVSEDVHDLPPDNGPFDEYKVADYPGCPSEWSKDGTFIPVHESQPLWFDFRGNIESACLASVQRINPATGETANIEGGLSKDPLQNYLKLPDQLWLDGYSKEGKVYQFVVVTEGQGEAVNEVLLPKNLQDSHAMGFAFYLPKPHPKSESNSNWWSPMHTPQNWISRGRKYGSAGLNHKTVTVPEYTLPGVVERRKKIKETGGVPDLIVGSAGDTARFTQNRVADNYNCVDPNDNYNMTNRDPLSCHTEGTTTASFDYDRAEALDVVEGIDGEDIMGLREESFTGLCASADDIDTSRMDQASMGAGGRIGQDIITDNNTVEYYQEKPAAILTIYLALPEMFEAIMKRGRRQDASRKDTYKTSGHIGGVPVPLV